MNWLQRFIKVNQQYYYDKFPENHILFYFVPTNRCNLYCPYCFLPHSTGNEPTMFDNRTPDEWIEAMSRWSMYDVEFNMAGGEPFVLDETFEMVKGFMAMSHVKWGRIDHNMTKVDEIIHRCPTPKVKLVCSYHAYRMKFNELWEKALRLNKEKMLGMINFVASECNLNELKKQNLNLTLIVRQFANQGIF